MPIGFLAPKGQLEKKPPHGDPCTSCGLCCMATLCPLGRKVFGREIGPCPALIWDEGKSSCGLVKRADEARAARHHEGRGARRPPPPPRI
jgi:hypothetical protein